MLTGVRYPSGHRGPRGRRSGAVVWTGPPECGQPVQRGT